MVDLSDSEVSLIAKRIRDKVFIPYRNYRTTVFLCGADKNDSSKARFKIARALVLYNYRYYLDLIYPEDMFEEFLYRGGAFDLLSLEDILAESVDVVMIIPESPGSFAELGAFANNPTLRKKIICLVDKKFKNSKSFLNYGPIKLVRKQNASQVIFLDLEAISRDDIDNILKIVRKLKRDRSTNSGLHFLQLEYYLIPLIYLLEPASEESIIACVKVALNDHPSYRTSAIACLHILLRKNVITLKKEGYYLSTSGLNFYHRILDGHLYGGKQKIQKELDKIRVEVLTLALRSKPLRL